MLLIRLMLLMPITFSLCFRLRHAAYDVAMLMLYMFMPLPLISLITMLIAFHYGAVFRHFSLMLFALLIFFRHAACYARHYFSLLILLIAVIAAFTLMLLARCRAAMLSY